MIELQGKYNTAKVFTDNMESEAISQIIELLNQEAFKDAKVRIMPDVHSGKGCVIGFTADLGDKIIPNLIGVDLGCGMACAELGDVEIDLEKLDAIIHQFIPSGHDIHDERIYDFTERINQLHCIREISVNGWNARKWSRQIGTLGGGNHFIELSVDEENAKYLIVHSGSRHLGKSIAEYYQNLAVDLCSGKDKYLDERDKLIEDYKKQGKKDQIQKALKELKAKYDKLLPNLPKDLCYLTGKYRDMYLHDMKIAQEFAVHNRNEMLRLIIDHIEDIRWGYIFHTIHNYIDFEDNIIRKGSIKADKDQRVLIPMNMRDGSLLCIGKGNADWNNSAPHGAGRLMSRSKAKEVINMEEYKETMKGVYSASVLESTIDEAPMAYKPMQEIIDNIGDTVEIVSILKPIYNFKASC